MKTMRTQPRPGLEGRKRIRDGNVAFARSLHPSTKERFPGLIGGVIGWVAVLMVLGSPLAVTNAGAAASQARAEDGPMMHASSQSTPVNAEPSVSISEVETWDEYRMQTDRTYIDEKGETQPLYQLLRPAKGNVYLHVVVHVATELPRSWATDEILVVDSPGAESERQVAPLVAFDEQGIARVGAVTEPSQKVALYLMYEVPAESWPNFYLRVADRGYGPLREYREPVPAATSAARVFF